MDVGAADKAAVQRVKVPAYSAAGGIVSDTQRCRIVGQATNRAMRSVNGPAALKLSFSGGCNLGAQRAREHEHKDIAIRFQLLH